MLEDFYFPVGSQMSYLQRMAKNLLMRLSGVVNLTIRDMCSSIAAPSSSTVAVLEPVVYDTGRSMKLEIQAVRMSYGNDICPGYG